MNSSVAVPSVRISAWPVLIALSLIALTVLTPNTLFSAVIGAGLLLLGLYRPVLTASIVLVLIPIVDQVIGENQTSGLFGALRITPAVTLKAMMTVVVLAYLWRHRFNPFKNRLLQPLIVWLTYTGFTCFTFHDRALAFSMWMRLAYWALVFMFFFAVAAQSHENIERTVAPQEVLQLWRAGLIALMLFVGSVYLAKALGVGGEFYGVGESYGFYPDPWNMAMTLPGALVIALLYPWISGHQNRWVKAGCIMLAVFTVLASYLTFTRTSLIACALGGVVFAFGLRRIVSSKETRLIFTLTIVIIACAGMFVYSRISSSRDSQLASRWSEVTRGDIGSGRLEVFYAAWSKFMNASPARKLLGHGIGAGPEAAEEFMGVYVYLHDDLLEMLVCAGLVGVALYSWLFVRIYREIIFGFHQKSIWALAALVACAVYNVTSLSYMRIYAVTPNTYFALVGGTSLGVLYAQRSRSQQNS